MVSKNKWHKASGLAGEVVESLYEAIDRGNTRAEVFQALCAAMACTDIAFVEKDMGVKMRATRANFNAFLLRVSDAIALLRSDVKATHGIK